MKINFYGDFVCQNANCLKLSEHLRNLTADSDFNVVNFEAPLRIKEASPILKSGPNISQSYDAVGWLEKYGFNCIAFANNHMMDFGRSCAEETRDAFSDFKVFGVGTKEECYAPLLVQKDNLKVAIFSLTHREFSCVEDFDDFGCAWMSSPEVVKSIVKIRKKVDYIFVYNHGGLEYCDHPLPQYRELYRMWIDLGVDAVVGSHPHIPQGWEEYNGKPIFYSLGNFCFEKADAVYPNFWNNSLCVSFNIDEFGMTYNVEPISYSPEKHVIGCDCTKATSERLRNLNAILNDNKLYSEEISKTLTVFIPAYRLMYSASGFAKLSLDRTLLKDVARRVLFPNRVNTIHLLNMYRCETHRWVVEILLANGKL